MPDALTRLHSAYRRPHCQPFRDLLAHAKVVPYLDEILGRGWRLDGSDLGVHMAKAGRGGHGLHGSTATVFDNPYYYHFANGQMRSGMLRVQYQLADVGPGIGGFACIPGSRECCCVRMTRQLCLYSHSARLCVVLTAQCCADKANYTCPEDIALASANLECIEAVDAKVGDAIIFLEATLHGALPWVATTHERRSIMATYLLR